MKVAVVNICQSSQCIQLNNKNRKRGGVAKFNFCPNRGIVGVTLKKLIVNKKLKGPES